MTILGIFLDGKQKRYFAFLTESLAIAIPSGGTSICRAEPQIFPEVTQGLLTLIGHLSLRPKWSQARRRRNVWWFQITDEQRRMASFGAQPCGTGPF